MGEKPARLAEKKMGQGEEMVMKGRQRWDKARGKYGARGMSWQGSIIPRSSAAISQGEVAFLALRDSQRVPDITWRGRRESKVDMKVLCGFFRKELT
jgi:hypothetical protein